MASIRELKKDIDYLVYELISDCFAAMVSNQDEELSDKLAGIVSDAINMRQDLISRLRHHDKKEGVKDHYRKLRSDLVSGIDELFVRLSKVVSS